MLRPFRVYLYPPSSPSNTLQADCPCRAGETKTHVETRIVIVLATMARTTHAIAHTLEAPVEAPPEAPTDITDHLPVLIADDTILVALVLQLRMLIPRMHHVLWHQNKLGSVAAPSRFLIASAKNSLCPATV